MKPYEMDDRERELYAKVRTAVEFGDNGDPVKDAIDEHEIVAAMRMLVELVELGYAV